MKWHVRFTTAVSSSIFGCSMVILMIDRMFNFCSELTACQTIQNDRKTNKTEKRRLQSLSFSQTNPDDSQNLWNYVGVLLFWYLWRFVVDVRQRSYCVTSILPHRFRRCRGCAFTLSHFESLAMFLQLVKHKRWLARVNSTHCLYIWLQYCFGHIIIHLVIVMCVFHQLIASDHLGLHIVNNFNIK